MENINARRSSPGRHEARRADAPALPVVEAEAEAVARRRQPLPEAMGGRPPQRPPEAVQPNDPPTGSMRAVGRDELAHIASFLLAREVASVSVAETALHVEFAPALDRLNVATLELVQRAEQVQSLQEFLEMLGPAHDRGFFENLGNDDLAGGAQASNLASLPADARARPLLALGRRVLQLPADEVPQAFAALQGTIAAVPAEGRTAPLVALDRIADIGDVRTAVYAGESVRLVADLLGLNDPNLIGALEVVALYGPAGHAARGGGHAPTIAAQYGIETPLGIQAVEQLIVNSAARFAVASGESVREVADRHGIRSIEAMENLSNHAINETTLAAVDRGENVQAIARRYGIESPRVIGLLEQHATYARPVIADLARGDTVPVIAERYGIVSAGGIHALDARAVQVVGERAVRAGESANAVVVRLGITSQDQIDVLEALAQRTREMHRDPWWPFG